MKKTKKLLLKITGLLVTTALISCQDKADNESRIMERVSLQTESFYGTLEPFASNAVYFLMTDRFVDGDPENNFPNQGGDNPTFQNTLVGPNGQVANVGYMGGDFQGILDNAGYIKDLGFGAIWLTPIVDQPDESFAGGEPIAFGRAFRDGGKTGYHGYWGVNFFKTDEHLPSKNLDFKQLTQQLREKYQIKTVLDIVLNHGSPAYTMKPKQQPKFGQLFDKDGRLIADQQNLDPEKLSDDNPLHRFYNKSNDILQLSDFNQDNPEVLDYFSEAYLYWITQGADAFRIDTIKHMPHSFWKAFSDRIRDKHSEFFMFAESYSFDADFIAEHTLDKNGGISVLDFPGREWMTKVFENKNSDFSELTNYLHLEKGPYKNPYELMTFYDNHDMSRMNADDNGFIDAHNWLFTSRGIPVIYYGSEIAFMAGTSEHAGNRNYLGQENIEKAEKHPVYRALSKVANIRKNAIALQKGLQVNLEFSKNKAAFYRIFEHGGKYQTALVMLNKGDTPVEFNIDKYLSDGQWREAFSNEKIIVKGSLKRVVEAHGISILFFDAANNNQQLIERMRQLMGREREASSRD
ncbi:alpha-amylase family glycosyl hydrolase [Aliikangiella coralliicola]|uniref:Alpha-amylase n=1 Tax=Aliikangiella coralliicola TaxID=2592383 RepID=A0A545UJN3_9GAMM|nr:alpha-amylase family glycosyl hydrolase [Aliikangiella coralliicola]TQV89679.1 cyclomaltodextrin glucanotransferase [Aliikangiella coralliicola]